MLVFYVLVQFLVQVLQEMTRSIIRKLQLIEQSIFIWQQICVNDFFTSSVWFKINYLKQIFSKNSIKFCDEFY